MTWEAIGAVGEFGGAIAVVATLAYLARQIRQGTAAGLSANHDAMIAALRETRHAVARDPSLAELVLRGEADPDQLTEVDLRRFSEFVTSEFDIWEQAFVNFRETMIDQVIWEGWDEFGREKLTTKGHKAVWKKTRLQYHGSFREHIEERVFSERKTP